jgi:hypothetical protein
LLSAILIATIAFVCVFGGALFGICLGIVLPKHYLSDESKEVVRAATAMVATLAALVLGLLVASAKGSYDSKESAFKQLVSHVILLDRTMAHYGLETREARELLREMVARRFQQVFGGEGGEKVDPTTIGQDSGVEPIQDKLWKLSPRTDAQRWLQSKALQVSGDIIEESSSLLQQIGGRIQKPLLAIVVFWLALIFASFGIFAPRNATVMATLFLCALSVGGALYLMLALDQPYSGPMRISSEPLTQAMKMLDREARPG